MSARKKAPNHQEISLRRDIEMPFAVSNLVDESVVVTTQGLTSFSLYIFNHEDKHFTNVCSTILEDEILNLTASEVSEDATRYIAVIVTKHIFHIISGYTNGSIIFQRNAPHDIKSLHSNFKIVFIPMYRQIACFCGSDIILFNPYDDEIAISETFLKVDSSKSYLPVQQDCYATLDCAVSMNNGPHVFVLGKSLITSYHSLKCCEVTAGGDVLVWWDADIGSSLVSVTRTSVYCAEDAVLVATGDEVRVYTLQGLLVRLPMGSALGLGAGIITAIRAIHTPDMPPLLSSSHGDINKLYFLVSTLEGSVFLCSVVLPSGGMQGSSPEAVCARRLQLHAESFSFYCSSFPTQVMADEKRHQIFLPYFDNISVLNFDAQLNGDSAESNDGYLLVKHSSFGVQVVRASLSPYEEKRDMSAYFSSSMFGVLDAFCCVDLTLPLDDSLCAGESSGLSLQYSTDSTFPLPLSLGPGLEKGPEQLPSSQYSSMLYRVERGTPLLSESGNEYPLDVGSSLSSLQIFTVVSDVPLDVIPITQRSYSNIWSTAVIMSSSALSESSFFTVNYAGKFQAVIAKTGIIRSEATLAFFRIRRQLVVQVTPSTINVLLLKSFQATDESISRIAVSSLSFPPGSTAQHVAYPATPWITGDGGGDSAPSSTSFNKRSQYNCSVFAVSSRDKFVLIQLVKMKCKVKTTEKNSCDDDQECLCAAKEVFSHTLSSDIYSMALSEVTGVENSNAEGEKRLVLAISLWSCRRSVQLISLLLVKGSCCILSIVNSSDMRLSHHLCDKYKGIESAGFLPFKYLRVCHTVRASQDERCYVVGGCMDGVIVVFDYEYRQDTCVWSEVNQWSSFVKGGIRDILLLSFFNRDQYVLESQDNNDRDSADTLHASAFIVNGRDADFMYRFKLYADKTSSSHLCSSVQFSRLIRPSSHRGQICEVHPFYLPFKKNAVVAQNNEVYCFVDNFLWVTGAAENGDTSSDGPECLPILCIGSKCTHHTSPAPVTVATKCRRLSFRVLKMIYLNCSTPLSAGTAGRGDRKTYALVMYSSLHHVSIPGDNPDAIVGVLILDCDTLSTEWEYSSHRQRAAAHKVVDISAAPQLPSVYKSSTKPPILFAFIIMTSLCGVNEESGVICSLFSGADCDRAESLLDVNLLHTLRLTSTFVENDCVPPFLVQPVGREHMAVASERGLVLLGWQPEETDEAFEHSLVELAAAPLSALGEGGAIVVDLSVQRDFESSVGAKTLSWNNQTFTKCRPDPTKMMRLVPDQFSTSTLCFTVYVSLASIGIDIFEFDCHSRRIERKGFISAQGLLLTDIIHSVIRPSTLADLREENSAQPSAPYGAIEIKTNAFSSSIVDASSGEDEIKFKGSLLCIDRRTQRILLYDSRQRWVVQGEEQLSITVAPVLLAPHYEHLVPSALKSSYVAVMSLTSSKFSVTDTTGHMSVYEAV